MGYSYPASSVATCSSAGYEYLPTCASSATLVGEELAASFFTHLLVALIAVRLVAPRAGWRLYVAACILCVLPDADAALHHAGVAYEHPFGHRGFTHSLLFAALAAGVAAALLREKRQWLFLFAVGASHGVLDAMTDGGLGVAFFFPDNTRHFLAWRPLVVGPIGIRPFFSEWGVEVMISEFLYVWLPLGLLLGVVELVRQRKARAEAP